MLPRILATPSSPELVPAGAGSSPGGGAKPALQDTELWTGPYELQDFHLYYTLRFGYVPSKIAFLAWCAWRDRERGTWPDGSFERNQYTLGEIKRHLGSFLTKFFGQSQFKRSCIPNGPKVAQAGRCLRAGIGARQATETLHLHLGSRPCR
jgi:NAD+ synthase (glutamine-hydrolysing)